MDNDSLEARIFDKLQVLVTIVINRLAEKANHIAKFLPKLLFPPVNGTNPETKVM